MLGQNGGESLNGTKDGSVDDHWSFEAWLKRHLVPGVLLGVVLIRRELLRVKNFLDLLVLVGSIGSLFLSSVLVLILKVESDWLLEINLNSSTLILSLEGVVDLNVNLWAIESAITVVESPGSANFVQGRLEGLFSNIPLLFSS